MDLYRQQIIDHYKNPRNFGSFKKNNNPHHEENPSCGDRISMEVEIKNGKIVDIKFSGEGCAIAIASASMLTEKVKGKKIEEVNSIELDDIQKMLGIPITPARRKCAVLGLHVLKQIIQKDL